jgi:transketolase
MAMADDKRPNYLRLAREATAIITNKDTPFEIGKSYVYREGKDLTIFACGTMVYESLIAAEILASEGIEIEIVNVPTIKPLDQKTIISSASKTRRVITVEEAQINGGLGGAVSELLSEHMPTKVLRLGMQDRFGESGDPNELIKHFHLDSHSIAQSVREILA